MTSTKSDRVAVGTGGAALRPRRGLAGRLLISGLLIALAWESVQLLGPLAPTLQLTELRWGVLVVAIAVCVLVEGMLMAAAARPVERAGTSRVAELGWTALPAILLAVLLAISLRMAAP